ncbi:MAG: DUF3500 domain-containing protein [Acidobacteriota bacterium]
MKRFHLVLAVFTAGIALSVGLAFAVSAAVNARRAGLMVQSANNLLVSLSAEQRAKAVFAFDDEERLNWHFVPRTRKGLPLKEMSAEQRTLAQALLKTGLGQRGYLKVTAITQLENVLREIEKGSGPVRDPELYFFSVFGDPSVKGRWGWRLEGHHVAFNFTVVAGAMVATTPAFLGANPAEVREGPQKGLRVLSGEEDLARALVQALDPKQQAVAIIDKTAPKDIISFNSQKADPLSPAGVAFSELNAGQKKLFENLIDEYLARMPEDLANERRQKMKKSGMDGVHFAWAGSVEKNQPHYYRVQGQTFLIEYDDTQNNANHIHSAWRDFDGDFGRDLLREHYQNTPHSK